MAKKDKQEKQALESLVEQLSKRYGEGAVMTFSSAQRSKIESISTGSFSLDLALGVGGFPKGRMIEVFGPESSGKTTLALHVLANAQKEGEIVAFIDAEHALDPDYAQRIGVKTDRLLLSQPDSGEQALQITEDLVRSGKVGVIVIDSVAALTPQVEMESEMGEFQIGLQARMMSQACRKLTSLLSKNKSMIIFLNQTRMKIGAYGNPETTPGGLALKFYSSVRVSLQRIAQIKIGDRIVGNRIKAKVVKNKVAPPFKTAEFEIYYNEGISKEAEILRWGVKLGVIKQSGASYSWNGQKLGQGIEKAKNFLKENPDIFSSIREEVLEVLTEGG